MSASLRSRRRWILVAAIPFLFCAIALVQRKIDAQTRAATHADDFLLLRSPEAVKRLSFGYNSLLADIYWTRAVQYYGSNAGKPNPDFHLLWPLLDVTTTLDPKLEVAYHSGAIFLSETGNIGAGRTDLAIRLVKKGIAANPDMWQLGSDLGFLYYWRLKDYPDAAATYLQTSKIPNSPPWLKMMAARISQTGGSLETSRALWTQLYESSSDATIKKRAAEELRGLQVLDDMQHLDTIAQEYKRRTGRFPASEQELRDAGLLTGIPADPAGFPYEFAPDGQAHLNSKTTFKMPANKTYAAPEH